MRQDIHLYIGQKEIYFSEPPEILFTFQRTDYTNPTLIKNSFTKTVKVEGTPENNKVFAELHLLSRTQNELLFNPAKRVDFQLFNNGDLVETGYAKLDNIVKDGYKVTYELTLYGGLGDFFYGLSYGFDYDNYDADQPQSKDEELKLKDLTYFSPSADDDTEFDFYITKDAVGDAWDRLKVLDSQEQSSMWDYINFAPAYNGLPQDFDADKVLINTSGYTGGCRLSVPSGATVDGVTYNKQQIVELSDIPSSITMDNETYTTQGGYAMAELREELTEWDVRDLRSYLQRPVLRTKGFIEAIKRYAKDKGDYTLNLDPDFFNSGNPYYNDSWITLPMLQNLNGEYAESAITGQLQVGSPSSVVEYDDGSAGINHYKHVVSTYNVIGLPSSQETYKGASITINFGLNNSPANTISGGVVINRFWTSYNGLDNYAKYNASYLFQLVAYDSNNQEVSRSFNYLFTTDEEKDRYYPPLNGVTVYKGMFNCRETSTTTDAEWYTNQMNKFTISLKDKDKEYTSLKLFVSKYIRYNDIFVDMMTGTTDYYKLIIGASTYSGMAMRNRIWYTNYYNILVTDSTVTYKPANNTMKSNQLITKQKLLSQDGTPCDYLISYCKLFNLYFDKDPVDKIITIRTRANFYSDRVIDLEKLIDRSKEINVKPIAADNKWYSFNYTQGDYAEMEKKYYNTWGTDYGKQKVKTEYNFDNSEKDLLEGNRYNNGLDVLEKSKYFVAKKHSGNQVPTFMYEWSDFKLFQIGEASIESVDEFYIGQPTISEHGNYNSLGTRYDFYPKLQLHTLKNEPIDGSNILVMFNGFKETTVSGSSIYYNITDDIATMINLNGDQTCWLYTNSVTDRSGNVIVRRLVDGNNNPILPVFNRLRTSGNTITSTFDFGMCNELFVPELTYGENATIYDKYWSKYIADLYDVKVRVVDCYVKLDGKVEGDYLKHFYYFDDSIWVLLEISDYNQASFDTTKCRFVKVLDMNNYTEP